MVDAHRHAGRADRDGSSLPRAIRVPLVLLGVVAAPSFARAADAEANFKNAESEMSTVNRETPMIDASVQSVRNAGLTPEERVANGEILFRSKDYARASVVLSEIIEKYPDTPSAGDARYLRAETYYASKEYLSARRDYDEIVSHSGESRYYRNFWKSLARLVDISLRLNDPKSLDPVMERLAVLPEAATDPGLNYARGKANFLRENLDAAQRGFQAVGAGTEYTHQARYFQGLIAMRQIRPTVATDGTTVTNYKPAIETFRAVTTLPGDTPEHQHVIDLAWMAIGRLFYEMDQFEQAGEAYSQVGRESPEFDTMLYELGWVYVRMGDVTRAERALEVLAIANPDSSFIADGTLLRADLLLRAGSFDKSLKLYESIRDQYEPLRARVDSFLASTTDVSVYYDKLSQQDLDVLDANEQLPPLAIRWAREEKYGPLAFSVIADVNICRTLIKQSNLLIERFTSVMEASNRVRAFPELLAGEQRATGLLNRIARARLEIARGLDAEESGDLSGEIGEVRKERRALMAAIQGLPTNATDFERREASGSKQWNTVSQELSRQSLEIDRLQALVNGLRRYLVDDAQRGVVRDAQTTQRFNAEIDANERDLKAAREKAMELRRHIELGRALIGFGDARYVADKQARARFVQLVDRETELAASGQAGSGAQRFAQRTQPILRDAHVAEEKLNAILAQFEARVETRVAELRSQVEAERSKIKEYGSVLETYDAQAKELVGGIAQVNFTKVAKRLHDIVLRADVGITEQAWEVREEEMQRVRTLQTDRARQEQLLDEELREVLDDAGGETQSLENQK
ncbi:MAG: tetratricopeptide repeat protein [Polyangiaceae bacterium]